MWDVVFTIVTVFREQRKVSEVLPAGVCRVQFVQLSEDGSPSLNLFFRKFNLGNGIPTNEIKMRNSALYLGSYTYLTLYLL